MFNRQLRAEKISLRNLNKDQNELSFQALFSLSVEWQFNLISEKNYLAWLICVSQTTPDIRAWRSLFQIFRLPLLEDDYSFFEHLLELIEL